jgi:hypothetical protein
VIDERPALTIDISRFLQVFLVFCLIFAGCVDLDERRNLSPSPTPETPAPDTRDNPPNEDPSFSDTSTSPDRSPADTSRDWEWDIDDDGPAGGPFELGRVIPSMGPTSGGIQVRVTGNNASRVRELRIGSKSIDFEQPADDFIVFELPPRKESGALNIELQLATNGDEMRTRILKDAFRYVSPLRVERIAPNKILETGGQQLDIYGQGFHGQMSARVGDRTAEIVRIVDANHMVIRAPKQPAGKASLEFVTPYRVLKKPDAVRYRKNLSVEHVLPASGPVTGLNIVEVRGHGFTSDTEFWFGNRRADLVAVGSANVARVRVPEGDDRKTVSVEATASTGSDVLSGGYHFGESDTPEVVSIAPTVGAVQGGDSVFLRGTSLNVPGLSVRFGGEPARILNQNRTFIEVQPPELTGTVDVDVTSSNGSVASLPDAFEYREFPNIESITPEQLPANQPGELTIKGEKLGGVERVSVGSRQVDFTEEGPGTLEVSIPRLPAGTVDITIRDGAFQAVEKEAVRFTAPIELWNFTPIEGSVAGDTFVELLGRGLGRSRPVELDGESIGSTEPINPFRAGFQTVPHPRGFVDIDLDADPTFSLAHSFGFYDPMLPEGGAGGGPIEGAVNVTVLTRRGRPLPEAFVMLSTEVIGRLSGVTDENGQVTISGPEVEGPQTVTAKASGYSAVTFEEIDSRDITLFLEKLETEDGESQPPPEVPSGTIAGNVKREAKPRSPNRDNEGTSMTLVRTTQPAVNRPNTIPPGDEALLLGDSDYTLNSRIGDIALIAICGYYRQDDDMFIPDSMGVQRHLTVEDGDNLSRDIVCDIPLEATADFKFQNTIYAPDGPDINRIRVFLDLGFDGVFEWPLRAEGVGKRLQLSRLPADDGVLSDMDYSFIAGSYTAAGFAPFSQVRQSRVESIDDVLTVPRLLDTPEPVGGAGVEGLVRFEMGGQKLPDFTNLSLQTAEGKMFWQIFAPGDRRQIQLPNFKGAPSSMSLNPYLTRQPFMSVSGYTGTGFDHDSFRYSYMDISGWSGISRAGWRIDLR